ncbi:MAG: PepSY domain-containing protein, partial [Pseudomonadaceae bacterium]|nr:PepSY domain-containing protein [Pseudomonadaceae bacterium]
GCYEIKGYDQQNNKIEAEYYPATLRLRKFEIEFDKDALIPDHLPSK